MEKFLDLTGLSEAEFILMRAILYYIIGILIKLWFIISSFAFTFLAVVRACDDNNDVYKKRYFTQVASVGILAIFVFFTLKYNGIPLALIFTFTARYWSRDKVNAGAIILDEWQQEWLPRLRVLSQIAVSLFRKLVR